MNTIPKHTKWKPILVLVAKISLLTLVSNARNTSRPFKDYEVILERKPFGEAVSNQASIVPGVIVDLKADFRVSGMIEGKTIRVRIRDLKTEEGFWLRVNETYKGLTLVSADYDEETAIIRKGNVTGKLTMINTGASGLHLGDIEKRRDQQRLRPRRTRSPFSNR